jgi:hypothetical protein
MKKKWFAIDKTIVKVSKENVEDEDRLSLVAITKQEDLPKDVIDTLKKRKFIVQEVIKSFTVEKGPKY